MTNHTPGPWRVIKPGAAQEHLPPFPKEADMRHLGIGTDDITPLATVWNHHHSDECKANARLIAAAPALLASLQDILCYQVPTIANDHLADILAEAHAIVLYASEPDACLIARAPDLLAENSKLKGQLEEAVGALEKVYFMIEHGWISPDVIGDTQEGWDKACQAYRDSKAYEIAKGLLSKLKEAGS